MALRSKKLKPLLFPIILAILFIGVVAFGIRADSPGTDTTEPRQEQSSHKTKHAKEKPAFDKSRYSIDEADSIWVVVNKSRPLNPITYAPNDLMSAGNGQLMRRAAVAALQEMFKAAATEGLNLQPLSGYRSYDTQQTVYSREVATYGQAVADTQSAKPGHSEHQTGLGIDIGGGGCGIEDCFGNTAEGKWVATNGHTYGFIIRYPEGKEAVTGYRYEPWHLRYVGKALAAEMKRTNTVTLEEFFSL